MNTLVTGGAGYIGSHTVRALAHQTKGQIIVYDNLVKGHRKAVQHDSFIEGDIADDELLERTIRKYEVDAVIHFAAYSIVSESMENPQAYYHNNVQGTLNLLDVMLKCGVNKLVFSSTAAVYGEPESSPIAENVLKNPTSVYGRTKLLMENLMEDYSRAYGLRYIALRYFNACGADEAGDIGEDHTPETHLIPLVLRACMGKTAGIKIFGNDYPTKDGTCIRDYIHVNDLAQAHVLALQALHGGHLSDAYNLGNGSGFSVWDVVHAAEAVTGREVQKEIAPRRPGDPAELVANCEKIKNKLQWQPRFTDINDIIRTAWQWHQGHPGGFAGKE